MIAAQPSPMWLCSNSGSVQQFGPGRVGRVRCSRARPRACSSRSSRPSPRPSEGAKSTSSHAAWPTSRDDQRAGRRSKDQRHGLRRPSAQTRSAGAANGLPAGALPSGFIRSSLPRRGSLVDVASSSFWALWCGSPGAAAVAGRDVELAVGAELQLAAVVVVSSGCGMSQDRACRSPTTASGVGASKRSTWMWPLLGGVVDVDVRRRGGIDRHRQQPLLTGARDARRRCRGTASGCVDAVDARTRIVPSRSTTYRRCGSPGAAAIETGVLRTCRSA